MSQKPPVIVEQKFSVPRSTVWKSITNEREMKHWFFSEIPAFKPEIGFETQFSVDSGRMIFRHVWKVMEVVPDEKLKLSWKYGGYPGESVVTFELFDENNHTRLMLTHDGVENFPQDIPEFTKESCQQGWEYFINQRLPEYLGK
jgi:uncharacterized protein YndB with AHSA1/START domain